MSFLSPLGILVQTVEFGKLRLRVRLGCLFLLDYLFRNSRDLWLKAEPFCLLSEILNSLRIDFFFDSFPIFHQKVLRFLIVNSLHQFRDCIDLRLKAIFLKLSLILLRPGSLYQIPLLLFPSHSSLVQELTVISASFSATLSFTQILLLSGGVPNSGMTWDQALDRG